MIGVEDIRLAALVRLAVVGGVGPARRALFVRGCKSRLVLPLALVGLPPRPETPGSFGERVGVMDIFKVVPFHFAISGEKIVKASEEPRYSSCIKDARSLAQTLP